MHIAQADSDGNIIREPATQKGIIEIPATDFCA